MVRIFLALLFFSTLQISSLSDTGANTLPFTDENSILELFRKNPGYLCDGFDFPVGRPPGKGYYVAQGFKIKNPRFSGNLHLGEDWNGNGGGNSDYGDPIYTIAHGLVYSATDEGGMWGNVVRIIHLEKRGARHQFYESVYGHFSKLSVTRGQWLRRGQRIGAMGNVNGLFKAHLHLELRSRILMELGGGYLSPGADFSHFLAPTRFIWRHRPRG
jgi:murein DD-endopeptidase MepM/ murein hydrolase activator NlpD